MTPTLAILQKRLREAEARVERVKRAVRLHGRGKSCGKAMGDHSELVNIDVVLTLGGPGSDSYQLWQCLSCGHFIECDYGGRFRRVLSWRKANSKFPEYNLRARVVADADDDDA